MGVMLVLHIVVGMMAFVGAILLGTSFQNSFHKLTKMQKTAVVLSYFGIVISAILGFVSAINNPALLIITVTAFIGLTGYLFLQTVREKN